MNVSLVLAWKMGMEIMVPKQLVTIQMQLVEKQLGVSMKNQNFFLFLEKNVNEYNKYSSVFILGEQSLTDWPSSISSSSRTCVNGSVFYKDGCVGGISGPLELEDCICRNEDLCNLSNTITVDNVKIMIFIAIMVNLFSYS